MSTIGYGEIYPITINERMYIIFMSLVACGVFGYSVSAISSILNEVTRRSEELNNALSKCNRYM